MSDSKLRKAAEAVHKCPQCGGTNVQRRVAVGVTYYCSDCDLVYAFIDKPEPLEL